MATAWRRTHSPGAKVGRQRPSRSSALHSKHLPKAGKAEDIQVTLLGRLMGLNLGSNETSAWCKADGAPAAGILLLSELVAQSSLLKALLLPSRLAFKALSSLIHISQ